MKDIVEGVIGLLAALEVDFTDLLKDFNFAIIPPIGQILKGLGSLNLSFLG